MNISDIAKMAGVSKGTVSRVINNSKDGMSEETRERILKIIEDVGYIPNRMAGSLSFSRTKTIGLIIPDIQNMFFPQMVRGVEDCAVAHGYTLFLCNSDSDIKKEEQYLRAFIEKRVDGILINTCGEMADKSLLKCVKQSGIPIVLLDRKSADFPDTPGIYVNNRDAAYSAVSHLIRTGCKNIVFLCGQEGVFTSTERLRGYQKALSEADITYRSDYVLYGSYSSAFGYEGAKRLLAEHPEADGFFTASDTIAFGAIRAIHEANIAIPEQISVVGIDDISFSTYLSPALTTVAQPIYDMGYHAMQKLLSCIEKAPDCGESEYMPTKLIVRQSTR